MKEKQLPPDKYLKKLGARIKGLRKQRGFKSYDQFAYEIEMSRTQYLRYEQGEDLQFSTLLRIIRGHKMTVKEFFSEGFDD